MTIQTALKEGQKAGTLVAFTISIGMFVFETLLFNGFFGSIRFFPATVVVILGWLLAILVLRLDMDHLKISMK
jgi:hypothetical protein